MLKNHKQMEDKNAKCQKTLHRSNQFYPQENCVNWDNFKISIE